jgi:flagellar motor switch protein FliG
MKEKGGIEVKMESTSEQEGMEKGGMTPEELAAQGIGGDAGKEGDEEMPKKYAPFEYINEENLKRLLGVFRKEPPQVIALVISYLKPELVRQIYAELPPDIQTKVAAESGALRQATEEQVRLVDENIKAKIDFLVGGVDNLIRILDEVDYKIRDNILEYLMNHRPQLYEKVRSSILLFEDVLKFPDLAVQTIIRELKTDQLARALKTSSPEIMNKFLSNMSQGGAALLKEEMEFGRPITDEQIEQERQNIINTVKKLESEGRVQVREKKKISIFESEDATSPLTPSMPEDDFMNARRISQREAARDPYQDPASAQSQDSVQDASSSRPDAASYLSYGSQLYSEEKYQEAIPYLQYAVELDQSNVEAYQILGNCYYSLGMTQEALQCYEVLLALTPQDEALKAWVEQFKQNAGV